MSYLMLNIFIILLFIIILCYLLICYVIYYYVFFIMLNVFIIFPGYFNEDKAA